MQWRELRERIDRDFRDDTEVLTMKIRGDVTPESVIVWMTPRTQDAATRTVGVVLSPDFSDRERQS